MERVLTMDTDVDNSFNGSDSNLNLVTRTEATATSLLIGIFLNLVALVMVTFSLGRTPEGASQSRRVHHNETVFSAAKVEFLAGVTVVGTSSTHVT